MELIDTLWNVNKLPSRGYYKFLDELIDTLWNVNAAISRKYDETLKRINRYIMECKQG